MTDRLAKSEEYCRALASGVNALVSRRAHGDVAEREYLRHMRDLGTKFAERHGELLAQYEMERVS